jgi:hypothetical protein
LALLLGNESRRDVRLTSLSVSRNNLKIAAFCDLMARFLGTPVPSIGVFEGGSRETTAPAMISTVLDKHAEGKPVYARGIEKWNDTADPVALIRNALTAQPDQNSTIVLAGPSVNLLGLLALPGSRELVQKKVRLLIAAPAAGDASGFERLSAAWPTTVLVARETDHPWLRFPAGGIENDFVWAPNHPLVDAYRSAGVMPYDAPATALAAALYAIRPSESFFSLSDRRLIVDAAQKDRVLQIMRGFVSARPPEPRRGARGGQP